MIETSQRGNKNEIERNRRVESEDNTEIKGEKSRADTREIEN